MLLELVLDVQREHPAGVEHLQATGLPAIAEHLTGLTDLGRQLLADLWRDVFQVTLLAFQLLIFQELLDRV